MRIFGSKRYCIRVIDLSNRTLLRLDWFEYGFECMIITTGKGGVQSILVSMLVYKLWKVLTKCAILYLVLEDGVSLLIASVTELFQWECQPHISTNNCEIVHSKACQLHSDSQDDRLKGSRFSNDTLRWTAEVLGTCVLLLLGRPPGSQIVEVTIIIKTFRSYYLQEIPRLLIVFLFSAENHRPPSQLITEHDEIPSTIKHLFHQAIAVVSPPLGAKVDWRSLTAHQDQSTSGTLGLQDHSVCLKSLIPIPNFRTVYRHPLSYADQEVCSTSLPKTAVLTAYFFFCVSQIFQWEKRISHT